MKLRLPSGEVIDTSDGTPSKRANKNRSGRSGRKAYQGRKMIAAVGGYRENESAIFAEANTEMCHVVPTATTGWMPDGITPRRMP